MSDIETFHMNLYKSDTERNSNAVDDFVRNLNFTKLSDEEKSSLDGKITLEECENILKTFQNGKSPGKDSYTVKFYRSIL